jgi:hypothetical protein
VCAYPVKAKKKRKGVLHMSRFSNALDSQTIRPDLITETPDYVAIGVDGRHRPVLFPMKPIVITLAACLDANRHEQQDYRRSSFASMILIGFHVALSVICRSQLMFLMCVVTGPWLIGGRVLCEKCNLTALRRLVVAHYLMCTIYFLLGLFWLFFERANHRRYFTMLATLLWFVQSVIHLTILRGVKNMLGRCMTYNSIGNTCMRLMDAIKDPNARLTPEAFRLAAVALELDPAAKQAADSKAFDSSGHAFSEYQPKVRSE